MHSQSGQSVKRRVYLVAVHIVLGAVWIGLIALALGYLVMQLWNAILPGVTGVKCLTYWQAVGLLLLCRILVGRFLMDHGHGKKNGHSGCGFRRREQELEVCEESAGK